MRLTCIRKQKALSFTYKMIVGPLSSMPGLGVPCYRQEMGHSRMYFAFYSDLFASRNISHISLIQRQEYIYIKSRHLLLPPATFPPDSHASAPLSSFTAAYHSLWLTLSYLIPISLILQWRFL